MENPRGWRQGTGVPGRLWELGKGKVRRRQEPAVLEVKLADSAL